MVLNNNLISFFLFFKNLYTFFRINKFIKYIIDKKQYLAKIAIELIFMKL
jgi:hypothetical protein